MLYDIKLNRIASPIPDLQNAIVYAIKKSKSGIVYFGTDKGLYKYTGQLLTLINARNGLKNENVRAIYEDENNVIWVGTMKGVYQLNNDVATSFNDVFNLKNTPITSICSDGKGYLS